MRVPDVNKLQILVLGIRLCHDTQNIPYYDKIQFQPAGAPVPLSDEGANAYQQLSDSFLLQDHVQVIVNTSFALRKPYVRDTPMGSHIMQSKKSTMYRNTENLKIVEYHRGGR